MKHTQDITVDYDYGTLVYPRAARIPQTTEATRGNGLCARELPGAQIQLSKDGVPVLEFPSGLKDELVGMSISADGKTLAICSLTKLVLFAIDPLSNQVSPVGSYRPYTMKHELLGRILGLPDDIPRLMNSMTLSADGTKVAIGIQNSWDILTTMRPGYGIVRVIEAGSMEQVSEHLIADSPKGLKFTKDGATLSITVKDRGEHIVSLAPKTGTGTL